MKQIRLIAEDFDRLDIPCGPDGTEQYTDPKDCPIARALKRKGYGEFMLGTFTLSFNDFRQYHEINGSVDHVEAIRKSLLAGAKYGIIKVLS